MKPSDEFVVCIESCGQHSHHSFVVHSGSLNFRALLSDLLLLVFCLQHQLTQQLPFPRDILGANNGEKFFQSNIWIYLWHLKKTFTNLWFDKIQIETFRICGRFEIGSSMKFVLNLWLKFSLVIFSRLNAPRRSESSVNMEPVMVLPSVKPSKRWKSPSTPSTSAHSAAR